MPHKDIEKRKAWQKEWNKNNKTKLKAYHRAYMAKYRLKPGVKECIREYDAKRYKGPTIEAKYRSYKFRSEWKNRNFNISYAEFLDYINKPCYYCGGTSPNGVGLDRVDNNRGYEEGNIVPCCIKCNRAKSVLTQEEFYDLCAKIVSKHVITKAWVN